MGEYTGLIGLWEELGALPYVALRVDKSLGLDCWLPGASPANLGLPCANVLKLRAEGFVLRLLRLRPLKSLRALRRVKRCYQVLQAMVAAELWAQSKIEGLLEVEFSARAASWRLKGSRARV